MGDYVEVELYLRSKEITEQMMRVDVALRTRHADDAASSLGPIHGDAQFDLVTLRQWQKEPEQYGQRLSDSLFAQPDILCEFDRARTVAQTLNAPLHVRLRLDEEAPRLHELRWETLRDPTTGASLLTGENILFARHLDPDRDEWRPVQLPRRSELRALVVVANPSNLDDYQLAPVDVGGELARAEAALGDIPLTALAAPGQATVEKLMDGLRDGCNVIYLVCHGRFRKQAPWLFLEDPSGSVQRVAGADFVARVAELSRRPVLVILASCQSAGSGESSDRGALAALGPRLVKAGIPVVVAMQDNVTMKTIATFAPTFFRELRRDGQIDRAIAVARGAVRKQPDWWVPVLFMWLQDGQLFVAEETQRQAMIPFHAEPLPPHFITRAELAPLCQRLKQSGQQGPIVTAVVGMGGSGKSTLARALAHETRVHFKDGVLWVTLGQQAELLPALIDRLQALGDHEFRATTVEAATQRLGDLLQEKQLLLVLDDAWYADDVTPFLVGGPHCHVLITTRRQEVADDVGAAIFPLGVMNQAQAQALLATLLDRDLAQDEERVAQDVARAVGYLPLALELVAARIRRGASWQALQDDLHEEVARLETLEPSGRRRRKGEIRLEASLNASLSWLRGEDEQAWRAFVQLGVLPEDVTLTAPMVATVWGGMAVGEAAELLAFLQEEALLMPAPEQRSAGRLRTAYTMHDLLHDLARRLLTAAAPRGLGQTMVQAHEALLARYRALARNDRWHTLPDDGYIHRRLTTHLQAAGQMEEIHALLQEENEDGRNGWYEARESLGQPAGYVADVLQAWQLAEAAPPDYGLQCRYALTVASLNSLASNVPTALLARLLATGHWTPAYALEYARQIGDAVLRAQALAVVLPHLPEALCRQAGVDAVQALDALQGDAFVQALGALLPSLPPDAIPDVLALLPHVADGKARSAALCRLLPALQREQEADAVQMARGIDDAWARARALARLSQALSRPDLGAEAVAAADSIDGDTQELDRVGAFADVLVCLPANEWPDALARVGSYGRLGDRYWVWAEARLLPFYPPAEQAKRLEQLLPVAEEMSLDHLYFQWPAPKALKPLLEVTPFLSQEEKEQLWAMAFERIAMVEEKIALLAEHAGELPPALVAAESIPLLESATGDEAAAFVNSVAPFLPLDDVDEGELTTRVEDVLNPEKVYPLALLIAHLPPQKRSEPARAALRRMRTVADIELRVRTIAALAPALAADDLAGALAAVRRVDDQVQRQAAEKALAAWLAPRELRKTDDAALQESFSTPADDVLARVAETPDVKEAATLLAEALGSHIWYSQRREDVVTRLVEGLAEAGRHEVAAEAIPHIEDETRRARWVLALSPYMQPEAIVVLYLATWDEAWAPGSPWYKIHLRAGLIPPLLEVLESDNSLAADVITRLQQAAQDGDIRGLPDNPKRHLRPLLLNLGLRAAHEMHDSEEKAHILARLAALLSPDEGRGVYRQALEVVLRLGAIVGAGKTRSKWEQIDESRPYAGQGDDPLRGLGAVLPEEMRAEALQKAIGMPNNARRADVLMALAPHLTLPLFEEVLEIARGLGEARLKAGVLARLAPHLPASAIEAALDLALDLAPETLRLKALLPLLQRAVDLQRTTGVAHAPLAAYWSQTLRLASRATRSRFLEHLQEMASALVTLGGRDAVVAAREAVSDVGRWWP